MEAVNAKAEHSRFHRTGNLNRQAKYRRLVLRVSHVVLKGSQGRRLRRRAPAGLHVGHVGGCPEGKAVANAWDRW